MGTSPRPSSSPTRSTRRSSRLIASGGHTLLLRVDSRTGGRRSSARTLDDAAGEAFDKGARMLGLGYPGGAALERLARGATRRRSPSRRGGAPHFSFAGLKTALLYKLRELGADRSDAGAAACAPTWRRPSRRRSCGPSPGAWRRRSSGPASTGWPWAGAWRPTDRSASAWPRLGVRVSLPPHALCTDNAAMIASAARYVPALPYPEYLAVEAYATGEGPLR